MKLAVLIVEDDAAVRDAIARDITSFTDVVRVEEAEDVPDAREVINMIDDDGDLLALVLADHRMPGETGVDLLVAMNADGRTANTRRVLITGQADQADTIRAVNDANLDHYIAKPWDPDQLRDVVRTQLTDFLLDAGIDPVAHMGALDASRVFEALRTWRKP